MQPKIVIRPSFTVVGMKFRGKNEHGEIPQLWEKFGPRMHEVEHVVDPGVSYGVMDNYEEATGEFDYIAGFEVTTATGVPPGMTVKVMPAQTYAVFPCTLLTIGQTYNLIHQKWLPESGYVAVSGPDFELYDEEFTPGDPTSEMYLYIPVEAAERRVPEAAFGQVP